MYASLVLLCSFGVVDLSGTIILAQTLNLLRLTPFVVTRGMEAVYLQTASASTPIAPAFASKQIHRNFAGKVRPVRW